MTCDACDAPAMVILPGQDEVRGPAAILLARAIPRRSMCLAHAKAAGFPWIHGEAPKRKRVQK